MNRYRVDVTILPREGVPDTQGAAVERALREAGNTSVDGVRVGKFISFVVRADGEAAASSEARTIAGGLLANDLIESYSFKLEPLT